MEQKLINDLDYVDGENQGLGVPERKMVPKRGILKKRSGPRKKRTCKAQGDNPGWRNKRKKTLEMHRDEGQGMPRGLGR